MRYPIILALALLTLAAACDENSFSQTVDIPIPEHEPLPAITMDLRSGDTSIYYLLALSRGILDQDDFTQRNMHVEIYKDEALLVEERYESDIFNPFADQTKVIELSSPISDEMASYRLVATVEGFEPVEATQQMLSKPEYRVVSYEPDGAIDSEGYRVDEVEIDLVDNPDTEDYYGFRVLLPSVRCEYDPQQDTVFCTTDYSFTQQAYLESPDPLLSMTPGFGLVVSDQSFNGNTYRVRFTVDNYQDARPILEVYHLTEDAYRYGTSRQAYLEAGDNPFAEPVNTHQNVTGGYGYFIVSNRVVEEL